MPPLPRPGALLADLASCLRFFSRLPVPALSAEDDPAAAPRFERAAGLAPAAGLAIALPAAAVGLALAGTDLPAQMTGAAVVAALALATGALHEDGLADTADGFWGGRDPARRLEIMRDSRIGSYGALALALTALARAAGYGALAERAAADGGGWVLGAAVLAAAAVSRGAMVAVWHRLPPARPGGLSAAAGQPSRAAAGAAGAVALAAALLALPAAGPAAVAAGLVLAALAAAGIAAAARAKIGGQTGDVLGATQQLAELAFLAGLLI